MKKIVVSVLFSSFFFIGVGYGSIYEASELDNRSELINIADAEDEDFYYVIDDTPPIQSRTWAKTQNYTIKNGARTYLGTYTTNRKTTLGVNVSAGPVSINLKNEYSESGKFKKYRQNCTIKVTYKRYRKVDNRYVDTKTVTSNTSYIDYVRI